MQFDTEPTAEISVHTFGANSVEHNTRKEEVHEGSYSVGITIIDAVNGPEPVNLLALQMLISTVCYVIRRTEGLQP